MSKLEVFEIFLASFAIALLVTDSIAKIWSVFYG